VSARSGTPRIRQIVSRTAFGHSVRRALVMLAAFAGLYLISLHSYLLFHALVELASVGVALGIFFIAWHARAYHGKPYLVFLGTAYLAAGAIDLLHTLAYKGMGVFVGHDANLPTQLWMAARYVQAGSLLLLPLMLERTWRPSTILAGYSMLVFLLLGAIFSGAFPVCYVEGVGLTPFKVYSEYAISLMFVAAMGLLYWRRRCLDRRVAALLMASMAVGVVSEILFTFYVDVYGTANLLGHLAKLVSLFFVCRAIIVVGLEHPYDLLFRELQQGEARMRAVLDILPVGVYIADREGRIQEANPAAHRIMGSEALLPQPEQQGGEVSARRRDNGRPMQAHEWGLMRALATGEISTAEELEIELQDGTRRTILNYALPIRTPEGSVDGGVAVHVDVTELEEAREASARERDNVIAILNAMEDLVYIVNEDYEIEYLNPALQRVFGPSEGRKCYEYTQSRQDPCPWCPNSRVFQGETVRRQWTSPDAGRTYDIIDTPLRRPGGSVAKLRIMRDITELQESAEELRRLNDELEERVRERTAELVEANRILQNEIEERRRTEERLREAEERFRVALRSGQIAVAHVDRDLRYTWIHNPHPDLMPEDLLGKRDDEVMPPEEAEKIMDIKREVLRTGRPLRREVTLHLSDGERVYDMVAEPLLDADGNVVGATTASLDITEPRQAELALMHAERLTLTGKLAASLAHEIKNPLQSIIGCIALAREALAQGGDATRYFEVAEGELRRVNDLLTQLRDVHRAPAAEERVPTDVNELVNRVVALSAKEAGSRRVEIVTELADDLPKITVGPGQIQQVFLNIVLNALDAMPEGGTLTISTRDGQASGGVSVAFRDTGVGMTPEVRQRIFQDFFSTKKSGLGLGLFISDSIVKQHGGRIDVETEEGVGTTFTVWLPR